MLLLSDLLDVSLLKDHLLHGVVSEQRHPEFKELSIYNYGNKAQTENIWDEVTMKTRGLIVNTNTGEVLARPFLKFFNLGTSFREETKIENLPNFKPRVLEKADGSLAIMLYYNDEYKIATRGSFNSKQAIWANAWYKKHCASRNYNSWPVGWTPLFEIIYDENRIVVNYPFEGLVLLGMVQIDTGFEKGPEEVKQWAETNGLRCIEEYDKTIEECIADNTTNTEGFVLQYWSNKAPIPLRIKIKTVDYVRLHKIITGLNIKGVWEHLRLGYSPEALYLPAIHNSKFVSWCTASIHSLQSLYNSLEEKAIRIFGEVSIQVLATSIDKKNIKRKEYAIRFTAKNPSLCPVLFAMLDGKPYAPFIWGLIEPKIIDGESIMRDADNFNGL